MSKVVNIDSPYLPRGRLVVRSPCANRRIFSQDQLSTSRLRIEDGLLLPRRIFRDHDDGSDAAAS